MSWGVNYTIRSLSPTNAGEREAVRKILEKHDLEYEADIEYSIGIYNGQDLVATGSLSGNVVKCVVISPDYRGENLTAKILTYLKIRAHYTGTGPLFLYTKPGNLQQFSSLGYTEIAKTENVLLMEDSNKNFKTFLRNLSLLNPARIPAASLVMNCNPFTLGHRYLVERTSAENEKVILFVVQENRSVFPFDVRLKLIREGVADIANVLVVPGGNYIISGATFPSYFIKDKGEIFESHTKLDLSIFAEKIAPAAGIVRRYVGHEPFCRVTESYNRAMQKILPEHGIEVIEIKRRKSRDTAISASNVRQLIAAGHVEETVELVPPTTYTYLISSEAAHIRDRLQGEKS